MKDVINVVIVSGGMAGLAGLVNYFFPPKRTKVVPMYSLEQQLKFYVATEQYEKAAQIRDQICRAKTTKSAKQTSKVVPLGR